MYISHVASHCHPQGRLCLMRRRTLGGFLFPLLRGSSFLPSSPSSSFPPALIRTSASPTFLSTPTLLLAHVRAALSSQKDENTCRLSDRRGFTTKATRATMESDVQSNPAAAGGVAWSERISLLSQSEAQAIDEDLMSTPGFSIDQLMELAGLSVAQAVDDYLQNRPSSSVLIIAGPGNNGGDGLVAARHLYHFGYRPTVIYPKRPNKPLYENLVRQCEDLGIDIGFVLPEDIDGRFDVVVDSMFGFGSTGPLRPPFDQILKKLTQIITPILSVDIPSGWDVEGGDIHKTDFSPEALISLTAPKKCAVHFRGRHYLGGRFVPPKIRQQYRLKLPAYPGTSQFVEIEGWDNSELGEEGHDVAAGSSTSTSSPEKGGSGVSEFIVVWVTAPSTEEGTKLAEGLVEDDLAACVNIVGNIESIYKWEGKVEKGVEVLLMAKTRSSLLPEFSAYIKEHHSYEVPETIAASIVGGGAQYLKWLRESTREPRQEGGGM